MLFTGECSDNGQTGEYLSCDEVELIDLFLHYLELWHSYNHKHADKCGYCDDRYADYPHHARIGIKHPYHSADTEYRGVQAHSQHYRKHGLYLLDIVGRTCDKARCGKAVHFLI